MVKSLIAASFLAVIASSVQASDFVDVSNVVLDKPAITHEDDYPERGEEFSKAALREGIQRYAQVKGMSPTDTLTEGSSFKFSDGEKKFLAKIHPIDKHVSVGEVLKLPVFVNGVYIASFCAREGSRVVIYVAKVE